jgi:hypothetical protein
MEQGAHQSMMTHEAERQRRLWQPATDHVRVEVLTVRPHLMASAGTSAVLLVSLAGC